MEIGTESRPGGAAVGAVTEEQLRQALLERYTPRMYEKISRGAAAIAGLGGLGSHIAVMLARAGVGHLFLVDSDRVEITNLNRQAYDITHLGQPKTEALAGILRNFGLIPATRMFFPFISGSQTGVIVSYILAGIILSIYRYRNILPGEKPVLRQELYK